MITSTTTIINNKNSKNSLCYGSISELQSISASNINGIFPSNIQFGSVKITQNEFKLLKKEYYTNLYKDYIKSLPNINDVSELLEIYNTLNITESFNVYAFLFAGIEFGTAKNKKIFKEFIKYLFDKRYVNFEALSWLDTKSILDLAKILGFETVYNANVYILTAELLDMLIKFSPYNKNIEDFIISHIDSNVYCFDGFHYQLSEYLSAQKEYFYKTNKYPSISILLDIK